MTYVQNVHDSMNQTDITQYWIMSADEDQKTAQSLFDSGRYHWCLFFWHLALERILKAKITKTNQETPFTHNLVMLAQHAHVEITEEDKTHLKEITAFNIEARYDDYKRSFYKKATKEYTQKWVTTCRSLYDTIYQSL